MKEAAPKVTVLIVDDHPVVRSGLRAVLETSSEIKVVGEVATGEQAIMLAKDLQPNVVLCDLRLGEGLDGIETTAALQLLAPKPAVLMLTTYDRDAEVFGAIEAGALGYLLKETAPEQIISGVQSVANGQMVLSPEIASRVLTGIRKPLPKLTSRETEVLKLLTRGATNKEISDELFITEATVKSHLVNIFVKLGVDSRSKAVNLALQTGLV